MDLLLPMSIVMKELLLKDVINALGGNRDGNVMKKVRIHLQYVNQYVETGSCWAMKFAI